MTQMRNDLYPIFLRMEGRRVLVVGGGKVAFRKARGVLQRGARVRIVAPELTDRLRSLHDEGRVEWRHGEFAPDDLEGAEMVLAATDNEEVNAAVYEEARKRRVLCNVADRPEVCDFFLPALIQRGALQIAVSTSGRSPALAAAIRRRLQKRFGSEYDRVLEAAAQLREAVRQRTGGGFSERKAEVERLLQADNLLDALENGDSETVDSILDSWKSYLSD